MYSSHPSSVQRYIYTILIFHIKERNWMCMLFMKYWFAWILFRGVYEEKNFRIYKKKIFFQTDIFGIMAVSHQTENKYYLIWTVKREKKILNHFPVNIIAPTFITKMLFSFFGEIIIAFWLSKCWFDYEQFGKGHSCIESVNKTKINCWSYFNNQILLCNNDQTFYLKYFS